MSDKIISKSITIGKGCPLTLISGPCVIESRNHTLECARQLVEITKDRNVKLIFKASYDKANRSSIDSFRGPGIEEGLSIIEEVQKTFGIPVITDIHHPEEAERAAAVADMLQIPAFLCRQTDLITAAAQTGKPINIKKGQFMAPWDMENAVKKALSHGCDQILLCDRGTCFGYNALISDFRSLALMREYAPVCFDASHSVQLPGGDGTSSGGERRHIPLLCRCATAAGLDALFLETHPNPEEALSDRKTVFPLNELAALLDLILPIHKHVSEAP